MAKDTKIMTASINLPVETLETIVDAENRMFEVNVKDAIEKLNERLQSGDCSAERCYAWLTTEKNHYEQSNMVHDF